MPFLLKFIKYCVVGFSGLLVDFGVTWICKERFKLNKYLSNSLGFTIAASSNYYLNRIWTFASVSERIAREFVLFFSISMIGLVLNNFFLFLFHEKMKLNFYFSKILAIGVVTVWNFIANYYVTFKV